MKHSLSYCRLTLRRSALPVALVLMVWVLPIAAQAPDAAPVTEEDIRGPRAPLVILDSNKFTFTQKILIITPVVITAGLLIWLYKRKRGKLKSVIPPLEQAREALRMIDRDRETLPAGDLAQQTANVVRQFITNYFDIAATQRTTEEFLKSLNIVHHSGLQAQAEVLREFLMTCDKAKFASIHFDSVERFALLETAGRFIQAATRSTAAPPSSLST